MSHILTKPTKWHVRPVKTDQPEHPPSLSESSMCVHWVAKDPSFLHADCADCAEAQADFPGVHPFCWILSWGGSNGLSKI